MQLSKMMFTLILWLAMLAGVGAWHIAIAVDWADVINYDFSK